ncbi:MAG TPA: hypothetical protein DD400_01650 [Rhodospirillaceae bacterium]|nr:hypothetical protein [Rhodospirillaceae bacterium]
MFRISFFDADRAGLTKDLGSLQKWDPCLRRDDEKELKSTTNPVTPAKAGVPFGSARLFKKDRYMTILNLYENYLM